MICTAQYEGKENLSLLKDLFSQDYSSTSQSNGDQVKAWEWDWSRTKGKNKAPSAVFAAWDRWKYLSSLSGEWSRHIRDGVVAGHRERATAWAHRAGPSALWRAFTARISGSQGCVPPVPRKGPYRHISILKCMEKPVLRPASFWHYTALPFYTSREKVLSERFVITGVVLWRRTWKPHFFLLSLPQVHWHEINLIWEFKGFNSIFFCDC